MLVTCLGHLLGQRGVDGKPKDYLQGYLRRTTWEIILPLGKARIFPWTQLWYLRIIVVALKPSQEESQSN